MANIFRRNSFGSGLSSRDCVQEVEKGQMLHRSLSAVNGMTVDEESFEDAAEVRLSQLYWLIDKIEATSFGQVRTCNFYFAERRYQSTFGAAEKLERYRKTDALPEQHSGHTDVPDGVQEPVYA